MALTLRVWTHLSNLLRFLVVNRHELVRLVAAKSGLGSKDADACVTAFFDAIAAELQADGIVRLAGFGAFSCVKRAEANGRDPRNGTSIVIKAGRRVKFVASPELKLAVNSDRL